MSKIDASWNNLHCQFVLELAWELSGKVQVENWVGAGRSFISLSDSVHCSASEASTRRKATLVAYVTGEEQDLSQRCLE